MEELLAQLAQAMQSISRAETAIKTATSQLSTAVANAKHVLTRIEKL